MVLYEDMVLKQLMVSKKFLENHSELIKEKLEYAADEFKREHGNVFAINMCLHAASSVILSNPGYLKETLKVIKETKGLESKDPTTVLTICTLYYLVERETDRVEKQKTKTKADTEKLLEYETRLKTLRKGFYDINWLVGSSAMRVLGFK